MEREQQRQPNRLALLFSDPTPGMAGRLYLRKDKTDFD